MRGVLEDLNPQQQKAVMHIEGPLLVLAGAGSGKTRVVTERILHLIEWGVSPSQILAVTFTNKAAHEMRERIAKKRRVDVLACTFHSLGARILRQTIDLLGYSRDFTIYDQDDALKLLKRCLAELSLDEKMAQECQKEISSAKNDLRDVEGEFAEAYFLYQAKLKECSALDFDDLLLLTVRLFEEYPEVLERYQEQWQFVLIDEYQDTNASQHQIATLLTAKHHNLFAVGDPDQSIYSWRGAKYQNILHFERDFPGAKVVVLDQNYRSTESILQVANALITHNQERLHKNLWSSLGKGEAATLFFAPTERGEAEFVMGQIKAKKIPLEEIAILYRTNAQSRPFEDASLRSNIPYILIGGVSFYERREVKDVVAFLKVATSPADLISFLRTINLPKRGLGAQTVGKWVDGAATLGMPIFSYCKELLAAGTLPARQKGALSEYVALIEQIRARMAQGMSIAEMIQRLLQESRYLFYLAEEVETATERKENVSELIAKAAEWETEREGATLPLFLEELSLRSPRQESEGPAIRLMTLHNSKGLEFDLVFLAGLEEDLLPHVNSRDNPAALEEERRLAYVGITRAKKELFLTGAKIRFLFGSERAMRPSRFVREIPPHLLKTSSAPSPSSFAVGDEVMHPEFGVGEVRNFYQGAYGLTYEVFFPEAQVTRSLVAKYAKLETPPKRF